jgi:hypothetical protein
MSIKPLIAIAAFAVFVSTACAQSSSQTGIGVSVGVFEPSSGQIRSDLGNQGLQFGLGGASTGRPSEGSLTPEYTLIIDQGNGNKLFALPFTYGYEYHFGSGSTSKFLPYVRPFAGIAYFDYSILDFASGQYSSAKQFAGTYGVEGGLMISKKIKISAAYNYFTKVGGFNFNGLTLSASYSLFSL